MTELSDPLPDFIEAPRRRMLEALLLEYRFTMISCLYWRNSAGWKLPWRQCQDTFFLFPESGTVRVTLRGETCTIRPGEFLMLAENTRHRLELEGGSRHLRQFALHCHIHDRWGRPLVSRFSSPTGCLPFQTDGWRALRELTCLMGCDPALGQLRGKNFLRELLAAQLAAGTRLAVNPGASDARVGLVLQRMEQDVGSPGLSVETLARDVRLTPVQLRKLFRRETGTSPRRFLNTLRMRHAARLLRHSSDSVKEIAAACGFSSDHYFHLAFRKAFGATPSQYRGSAQGQF